VKISGQNDRAQLGTEQKLGAISISFKYPSLSYWYRWAGFNGTRNIDRGRFPFLGTEDGAKAVHATQRSNKCPSDLGIVWAMQGCHLKRGHNTSEGRPYEWDEVNDLLRKRKNASIRLGESLLGAKGGKERPRRDVMKMKKKKSALSLKGGETDKDTRVHLPSKSDWKTLNLKLELRNLFRLLEGWEWP